MKKFYFLMASALMGLSATAADYWCTGANGSWDFNDTNKMTEVSPGVYEVSYATFSTAGFQISGSNWSPQYSTKNRAMEYGQTYTLTDGGYQQDMAMAKEGTNVKVTFDANAKTLLVTSETEITVEYCYYIKGSVFGDNWASHAMTETDGKWSFTATSIPGELGLFSAKVGTSDQIDWIAADGTADIELGTAMKAKVGGSNWKLGLSGEFTYTFDPAAMTLTVTGEAGETPDPEVKYVLRGQIFGAADWADYEMFEDNGVWTYTGDVVPGNFGIKQETNGQQTAWYSAPAEYNIMENGVYQCTAEGTKNFTNHMTGDMTLAFDPAAGTLTISGYATYEPVVIDYTTWYLNVVGTFNEWNAQGVQLNEDGVATATNLPIGTSEFKLKIWDGSNDNWYSTGSAIALDTEISITDDNASNMTVTGAEEGSCYDVTYDAVNKTMTVKNSGSTGLENIATDANAPVEYFNLQGIRINDPVKGGLYIRRQGNTATKVLVK